MRTVIKTIEVIDKFEDEFHTQSWESFVSFAPENIVNILSTTTGFTGTIPVNKEFIEELQKRNYAKFKMEITFLD